MSDTWRLTKGQGAQLFGVGICLMVILILLLIISSALTLALGGAQSAQLMSMLKGGSTSPASLRLPPLSFGLVARYLVQIPLSGCIAAIFAAPWAKIYRDLAHPDVAATFA
jgi:hypothetical protein